MAGAIWSETPPTEAGWYWLFDLGAEMIAEFRDELWWWDGDFYTSECMPDGLRFGPRIPSPEELAALSKLQRRERPDDSEIDAVLREAFGIHDVDRSTKLEETK